MVLPYKRFNNILQDRYDYEIVTDSSLTGWGAYCQGEHTSGWWSPIQKTEHINFLELKAIFYGLKKNLKAFKKSCQILLKVDNSTAISYINRMGSIKHAKLNRLARKIWDWCEFRDIWIHATYIASKCNLADSDSRVISLETEWQLGDGFFQLFCNNLVSQS